MILKVFTVYDSAAELFLQPFFARNEAEAVRSFTDAAVDPNHSFCKHARDYTLYELGEYAEENGAILSHVEPRRILGARQARAAYQQSHDQGIFANLAGDQADAEEEMVL